MLMVRACFIRQPRRLVINNRFCNWRSIGCKVVPQVGKQFVDIADKGFCSEHDQLAANHRHGRESAASFLPLFLIDGMINQFHQLFITVSHSGNLSSRVAVGHRVSKDSATTSSSSATTTSTASLRHHLQTDQRWQRRG